MAEDTAAVSVIINAPVEHVWPLLIEHQQPNEQEMLKSKYIWCEPEGPLVAGQVIHMKLWFLHLTISIQQVVQAESPMIGQTISARVSFLGRSGETFSRWDGDSEHYHLQAQSEIKHPWLEFRSHTSTRCLALDPTSCVVVCTEQSQWTFRLLPRWLTHRFDQKQAAEKGETRTIETSLQKIKAEAEQTSHHRSF